MKRTLVICGCAAILAACAGGSDDAPPPVSKTTKRLVVIGVDGMDPALLRQYIDEGRVPNLARLAAAGNFKSLQTTDPPQSPVAWSTFITGLAPDGHGIYDFVHRDPNSLEPYLSTARTRAAKEFSLGPLSVTTTGAKVELLRDGVPFWTYLEAAGIPAAVIKIPANFPALDRGPSRVLSGMGTPDLMGGYGTYQLLTDAPQWTTRSEDPPGGTIRRLRPVSEQRYTATLLGPPTKNGNLIIDAEIIVDRDHAAAVVDLGGSRALIEAGKWSEWLAVEFNPGLTSSNIRGEVRLYLQSISPNFTLYVSPVNLDPRSPAMPISSPPGFSASISADIGRFYTQGMAEDTKAYSAGVLNADEFLAQANLVYGERLRLLDHALAGFDTGLLFFYFSTIDQLSHMFFRSLDPQAAEADRVLATVIPGLYTQVDTAIGHIIDSVGSDTTVIVMSDHGFSHYRRKVHLNSWLAQRGYLVELPPAKRQPGTLGHIDWAKTRAYALGLNQLFINAKGRERNGSVDADGRAALVEQLRGELLAFRDPDNGKLVVSSVEVPAGTAHPDRQPDVIVGYSAGYRSSDTSALGEVGSVIVEHNRDKWSGDHCMDPAAVPGVLLSNTPLAAIEVPSLLDMAPTILEFFDVPVPAAMTGRTVLVRQ